MNERQLPGVTDGHLGDGIGAQSARTAFGGSTPMPLRKSAFLRWSQEIGQAAKVGSTERKDGPDDGKAEAVFG